MKYTVEYFYNKFAAIPDDKWCKNFFKNSRGQSCVMGHCGARWTVASCRQARKLYNLGLQSGVSFMHVNDGEAEYILAGATPKERVLNMLVLIGSGMLEEV